MKFPSMLLLLGLALIPLALYLGGVFDPISSASDELAGRDLIDVQSGPGNAPEKGARAEAHRRAEANDRPDEELDAGEVLAAADGGSAGRAVLQPATIRLQLVDLEKKPVPGVEFRLLARVANVKRKRAWPFKYRWKMPRKRTDARGRIAFRFIPPPPCTFTLQTHGRGFVAIRRTWKEIESGALIDLGQIKFLRGGAIEGIVRNERGQALSGGWKIRASREGTRGGQITRTPRRTPPGSFRFENLPEGRWRLQVRVDGGLPEGGAFQGVPSEKVEIKEGKTAHLTFRYEGPPLRSRITIDISAGVPSGYPAANQVLLLGSAIGIRPAGEKGVCSGHTWDGLPWGSYTVEVRDPRFQPWRKDDLLPSLKSVPVKLLGNSTLHLKVVDASGEPCARYAVKIMEKPPADEKRARSWWPDVKTISRRTDRVGGKATIEHLIAGEYTLIVDADGYTRCQADLPALQPNEVRELQVTVRRGGVIAGVVIDPDGKTPLAGAAVALRPFEIAGSENPDTPGRMMRRMNSLRNDSRHGRVESDERGRFRFENLMPGVYVVEATYSIKAENMLGLVSFFSGGGSGLQVTREGISIADGEKIENLRLPLPLGAYFQGLVIGPPGASFDDLNLRLRSETAGAQGRMRAIVKVDSSGRFEVGPLRPGPARVTAVLFSEDDPGFFGPGGPVSEDLGEVILAVGEPEEHTFDLRDRWPGRVRVLVRREGEPVEGARVSLEPLNASPGGGSWYEGRGPSAETDESGRAEIARVFAGARRVSVSSNGWRYISPAPIAVPPGGDLEVTVAVEVYKGRLQLLHAGGEKLRKRLSLRVYSPDRPEMSQWKRTDEQGFLELELMPGRYSLADSGSGIRRFGQSLELRSTSPASGRAEPQGKWPVFQWTSAGPVPAQVRIPIPKDKAKPKESRPGGR